MGYPEKHNWKDLIDENTVVYFDGSQLSFTSACSNEERSVLIKNNKTGEEYTYKNKTGFFGQKRKTIDEKSELGKINSERVKNNLEPFKVEDFTVTQIQIPKHISFLCSNIKTKIASELEYLGLSKYYCVIDGDNNFRLDLEMPERYKSNRADAIRPLQLKDAKDYLIKYKPHIISDKLEADDILTIKGYEGYQHYLKTGKFSNIVVSFDKDGMQCPSLVWDNFKDKKTHNYQYPIPFLIENTVGELFLDGKSYHGYGFIWLCFQLIYGDPQTDAVYPYQNFEHIKFGEASAFNLLSPLTNQKELLEAVVATYKSWFPEEFEFVSWTGKTIKSDWLQWAETIFACVYMKRVPNDKTTFEKLLKYYKVDY